jgi:hypothetical protein
MEPCILIRLGEGCISSSSEFRVLKIEFRVLKFEVKLRGNRPVNAQKISVISAKEKQSIIDSR